MPRAKSSQALVPSPSTLNSQSKYGYSTSITSLLNAIFPDKSKAENLPGYRPSGKNSNKAPGYVGTVDLVQLTDCLAHEAKSGNLFLDGKRPKI